MNDPNFGEPTIDVEPNCVVQPLLDVVICVGIKASKELCISYNHK